MLPCADAMPFHVGYVVKRFPKLSETFVLNEIAELERMGVRVDVFSLKEPKVEPQHVELLRGLKARVHYLDQALEPVDASSLTCEVPRDFLLGKEPEAIVQLHRKAALAAAIARMHGCHHLHAHFANDATLVAALAAREAGLPMSFTAHAKDIYHTYTTPELDCRIRRAKIAAADFVVTVTDANKSHLQALAKPVDSSKIVRIHNGIDTSRFCLPLSTAREETLLLAVGRLVEKKGYSDLLQAIALCRARLPGLRLLICGDGPLRPQIEADIEALGLESCVELLGAIDQSHVQSLMQRCTALVLPSLVTHSGDRDALPTVLLEAQASGLPVITTNVSGIPEIVTHNVDGLLVPQRDPISLAGAIDGVLQDRALALRLARAGRENILRRFNLKHSVAELLELFQLSARKQITHSMPAAKTAPAHFHLAR